MLIRVLFVVLVAFPLAVTLTVVTAFAGDQSAKDQNANNTFTRALERPAPQRDLRDNLSNQIASDHSVRS